MPAESAALLAVAARVLAGALVHALVRAGMAFLVKRRVPLRVSDLANALACGVLVFGALALVAPRLEFPLAVRTALLGSLLFVVGYALNIIEYFFFSTTRPRSQIGPAIGALVLFAVTATAAALLLPPAATGATLGGRLADTLSRGTAIGWIGRFAGAIFSYVLIYILVGSAVWPIVKPSYVNPPAGLDFRVPRPNVIFPLQLSRGFVFSVVVCVLIAATGVRGADAVIVSTVFLAVVGGVVPLLSAVEWPLFLRVVHGIEVATQQALFGVAGAWFLGGY